MLLGVVFAAQIVISEDQRSAGVLLLDQSEEVGRKTDLGFDLLFAVTEVVVRDECHDHPGGIPRGQFEGVPVVIELPRVAPTHAVSTLTLAGLVPMRKSHFLLCESIQVRSQDHASGVSAPMLGIEGGVIFWEQRVAGITEDALDEIEVRHQRSGDEETNFHALARHHARNLRADDRANEQRDHARGRRGPRRRERQLQKFLRRMKRAGQKVGKNRFGDTLLVIGNGQPSLGDMKDAGGSAPVRLRIVKNPVAQPIAAQHRRGDFVFVGWQGQDPGQAILIQDEGVPRQFPGDGRVGQIVVDEVVNPAVHRTGMTAKQSVLLAALGDKALEL